MAGRPLATQRARADQRSKGVVATHMLICMRFTATALLAMCLPAIAGGCHVNVETGSPRSETSVRASAAQPAVPKRDVEQITAQLIRDKSGGGPYVITCPGDLPIKLGANMRCVLADQQGTHRELTVTITKADSPNNAAWDWEVGGTISDG